VIRGTAPLATDGVCAAHATQPTQDRSPSAGEDLRTLPGPRSFHPLGSFAAFKRDPLAFLRNNAAQYGDIYRARFAFEQVVFFNRPSLIESILSAEQGCVLKGVGLSINRPFFGEGLFVAEGERWLKERRVAQPFFSTESLDSYVGPMAATIKRTVQSWPDGTLDVQARVNALTIEVIGHALFATGDLDPERLAKIFRAVTDNFLEFFRKLRYRFGASPGRKYWDALRDCDAVADQLIRAHDDHDRSSYLARLVSRLRDGEIEQSLVRDQIVNFLFGGHVTTALTASFALHLLAHHPGVQERLREELSRVSALASLHDLDAVPGLMAVINETLRLYPPVWGQTRTLARAMVVGGLALPPRTRVVMSPFVMHHQERYFDDPDAFVPERWTPAFRKSLPKGAFFPFGLGPRACIGHRFATMEVALIVFEAVKHLRFTAASARHPVLVPTVGLRPQTALQIDARRLA
jgi:cytochrome P450